AEEVEVENRPVLLVDTAGLEPAADTGLPAAIQAQAQAALAEADAILFVVDGRAGRLPGDDDLARLLHRAPQPVSLLVNKLDLPQHDAQLTEFLGLGFERCQAVSAEHGRGAWDALEELVALLPEGDAAPAAPASGTRIAVVGRPNAGKSSLVNRLCGEERVVVSEVPGTTRDTVDTRIEWEGRTFTLVDTAGLRRSGRRDRTAERVSALMTVRALDRADVALVVVDAADGVSEQDARICSLALDRGCACVVLANKWDVVAAEGAERGERVRDDLAHALRFASHAPVVQVSARTGAGIQRILPLVGRVGQAGERRIPTADLNRWLERTVARHEPAMAQRGTRRKPVKFLYATQIGVRPPSFALFCSAPNEIQASYKRFLENRLRADYDFEGTPVRLFLRARAKE
ncbi:MAG: ribosome biogenesis GTPase Der, partial [Myxococcota bacterium]|nr:ribosome biogenesis GTPase Der [Myxococcota bacterium]